MSFLKELCKKKSELKSTDTIVTCADGRRFLESTKQPAVNIQGRSYGFIVDDKPDNIPAKIIEYLFLGSQDCCEEMVVNTYNIESVLSIGVQPSHFFKHINYHYIYCLDLPETNFKDILEKSVIFIKENVMNKKNVLVHCNAGVSRSSAVVIGFLMLENKMTYAEAYGFVKQKRNCIKPNIGFEMQLKNLQ